MGLLSIGTFVLGLIAIGAISVGLFSLGSLSVGQFTIGAYGYAKYASLSAIAYGDIAITSETGKAYGNVMNFIGDLSIEDKEMITTYLDANVPEILSLFKKLFLLFIQ